MSSLVIKHSGLPEKSNKPWEMVIRTPGPVETDYEHVCYLTDEKAVEVINTGNAPYWLHGEPDWDKRDKAKRLEKARVLREEADKLEKM